jgi:hypothetical protein
VGCPGTGRTLHPGWSLAPWKSTGASRSWHGFLLAPLEGSTWHSPGLLLLPGSQDPRNLLLSLPKAEPGAGDIRELILVPTGDSFRDTSLPRPAGDDTPTQPSFPLGGWSVSPQSCLHPSRPHNVACSHAPATRLLLPHPVATPAGTGMTAAQSPARAKRAPRP